ncbi:MAG: membrane-bound lytic murein transglycosylase MltF [Deltaproteobacteria bacterium]|nr:MAG: membrane-bound lytic murein transglycosylase MltF [Deltaproteobacteria bacterium]
MLFPFLLVLFALNSNAGEKQGSLHRIHKTKKITVITRNNAHCYYIYREEPMGFEYNLARAFANYLGVGLTVKTFPWADMIKALNEGRGDFIAASKTITPSRKKLVDFSNGYLSVRQRVVIHEDNRTINKLVDLNGKVIHIRRATSYEERLSELKKQGLDFTLALHDDVPTEELIRQVADKQIEVTVADSNIAQLNRRYYPNIKIGIPIAERESLGWAVKKQDKALLSAINTFFEKIKTDGTFDDIYRDYYANVQIFDRFDLKKFHQRINLRLPKYETIIKKAAKQYGFDWRLIAAIIYQESHFNPRARSHRGVRGLMQLTKPTAQEMGVTNRLDPEQSVMGGVRYLRRLYQRYDEAQGFDRILITLASYNVGPRHITSAQRIAREKGLDSHKWSSLEQTLPLLCYEKYIRMSKHGYCRGSEPVRFVNRILAYFDILRRQAI